MLFWFSFHEALTRLASIFFTCIPTVNFDLISVFVKVALQIVKRAQHFVSPWCIYFHAFQNCTSLPASRDPSSTSYHHHHHHHHHHCALIPGSRNPLPVPDDCIQKKFITNLPYKVWGALVVKLDPPTRIRRRLQTSRWRNGIYHGSDIVFQITEESHRNCSKWLLLAFYRGSL